MNLFRIFLLAGLLGLVAYTAAVVNDYGWNLLEVFFGDMKKINWAGQFNLDFTELLALSALWTAWRSHFSTGGLALSVVAFFGGSMFLYPYLLVLSFQVADVHELLVGQQRAAAGLKKH